MIPRNSRVSAEIGHELRIVRRDLGDPRGELFFGRNMHMTAGFLVLVDKESCLTSAPLGQI